MMLTNFIKGKRKSFVECKISFTNTKEGWGYDFPCDSQGKIDYAKIPAAALKNYNYAMAHPELFDIYNYFNKQTYFYKENPQGICECGCTFDIYNQYFGACQCPGCGQWYNLMGQELNSPDEWEED